MDLTQVDNVEIDGINPADYPDFCDAYIIAADYNGEPMSEAQLNKLNECSDFVYDHILKAVQ